MFPSSLPKGTPDRGTKHSETLIAEVTFTKWVKAGRPKGEFDRFWQEAMEELFPGPTVPNDAGALPPKG